MGLDCDLTKRSKVIKLNSEINKLAARSTVTTHKNFSRVPKLDLAR